ncbi:PKD domain-containing protein [bacterium]|nr:PKD domain-containing protein [bacterium]
MSNPIVRFVVLAGCLALASCGRSGSGLEQAGTAVPDSQQALREPQFSLRQLPADPALGTAELALSTRELSDGSVLASISVSEAEGLRGLFYELDYDAEQYSPVTAQFSSGLAPADQLLTATDMQTAGSLQHGAVIIRALEQDGLTGSASVAEVLFRAQPFEESRAASKAPKSRFSQATLNLDVTAKTLSWGYANEGDYDQNSEVNVADLAPLGTFFQENTGGSGPFPAGSRFFMIDGDRNGELNIADLAPIGTNFQRSCASYNVYRSLDPADIPSGEDQSTIEPLGFVNLADGVSAETGSQLQFSFALEALNSGWFYWVRPCDKKDGAGLEGVASNIVSTGGKPDNEEPTAQLSANPLSGNAPLAVSFDASGSTDSDGTIIQFAWDFDGDGLFDATTTVPTVSNTYQSAGVFTARVQVTDSGAATASAQVEIVASTVNNEAPNAVLQLNPASGTIPLEVTLDASGSTDDGVIFNHVWDFDGDGDVEATTGSNPIAINTYTAAGNLSPKVTVVDNFGLEDSASASLSLVLGPQAPVAVLVGQTEFVNSLQFYSAENSTDADGTIVRYQWDLDADGLIDGDTGDSPFINITVPPGLHELKLIVTDDDGLTGETSLILRSRNNNSDHMPPFASFTVDPLQGSSGISRTLDASASTVGDGEDGTLEFHWDFDGNFDVDLVTSNPVTQHTYIGGGLVRTILTVRQNNSDGTTDDTTVSQRIPVGNIGIEPLAKLTATPRIGVDPHTVLFDASESIDFNGTIEKFEWDIDGDFVVDIDGGTNPLLEQVYTTSGTVFVNLIVTDNDGQNDFAGVTVVTSDPDNPPPTAVLIVSPENGSGPREVTFNATASTDDSQIVSYQFDIDGDGDTDISSEDPLVTVPELNINGTHTARVTVVDDDGGTAVATDTYTITGGFEKGTIEERFFPFDTVSARVNGSGSASVASLIYYNGSSDKVHFSNSADASGTEWESPGVVLKEDGLRNRLSLKNVFFAPSTALTTGGGVLFAQASDTSGFDWTDPITVASRSNLFSAVLTTASVNPAILFIDRGPAPDEIRFIRSTSATGATWPATEITAAVADSSFDDLSDMQTLFVNGRPAVFYTHDSDFDNLRYVRAAAADGSSWGTPVEIPGSRHDDGYSVAIIDGRPAVTVGGFFEAPRFIRANDADGTSWGSSVLVDPDSGHLERSVLAEIDNRPHVFWVDRLGRYRMAVGTSSSGSFFIDTQVIGFGSVFDSPQALLSFDNRAMVIVTDRDGNLFSVTEQ